MASELIQPHGGELVDLMADDPAAAALKSQSRDLPSYTLGPRHLCDLELLLTGGFSPLRGFMGKADYERVCTEMRLSGGTLWPIPITLDVDAETAETARAAGQLALRDVEGVMLAVLTVSDVWQPDLADEAEKVFGGANPEHPGVNHLMRNTAPFYVGGSVQGVQLPVHYDFTELRRTPAQLRAAFEARGWNRVVAFQTRNPMHRAHVELTRRAAVEADANLLIHPVVGMTKPGDVDHYTRGRVYQHVIKRYPEDSAMLAMLPLAMRMGGPREAVWHAIIRKNHGVSHFIVGRDHAGPGADSSGTAFYGPYEAQEMLQDHTDELGVTMVPFKMMVYVPGSDSYQPVDQVDEATATLSISGTELRDRLASGDDIPEWFSYPEVVAELRRTHPQRSKQGFTVFFTGLSGSGKSTIANALMAKLLERGGRPVTLLDGDVVRTNLSSELGFSKEHRDINITRIGYVASEITKHGGIAICAPIAPYAEPRRLNREAISTNGGYVLVYVATPLEVCEERDRKGLYAKARAGIIKEFTGISDPYEVPADADIVLPTVNRTPDQSAQVIVDHLVAEGYLQ
ncbi:bifunctional sulfate adenylyltransferase/adenylylsulfate kinase [Candidatus Poriferisocius sp.]|uniref:bifunctional sulfate adenylyltransferase/adenylylsulfate kinase n=1 Tax=Candidatus Poriferisocius sp. TaxID=3101276 RepID=UPI003B01BAD3